MTEVWTFVNANPICFTVIMLPMVSVTSLLVYKILKVTLTDRW